MQLHNLGVRPLLPLIIARENGLPATCGSQYRGCCSATTASNQRLLRNIMRELLFEPLPLFATEMRAKIHYDDNGA